MTAGEDFDENTYELPDGEVRVHCDAMLELALCRFCTLQVITIDDACRYNAAEILFDPKLAGLINEDGLRHSRSTAI